MNPRRLYRSRRERMLAGVAGGIADYLDVDPTVVRILWIISIFFGGFGILLYIILAFIMPLEPVTAPPPGPWPQAAPGPEPWQAGSGVSQAPGSQSAGSGQSPTGQNPTGQNPSGQSPTGHETDSQGAGDQPADGETGTAGG